jgi:hypothetical protein
MRVPPIVFLAAADAKRFPSWPNLIRPSTSFLRQHHWVRGCPGHLRDDTLRASEVLIIWTLATLRSREEPREERERE